MGDAVVIVGTSVAGIRTAQALRTEGFSGPIRLVGAEQEAPYDKPPLSKEFLAGRWEPERLALLDAGALPDVEWRLGAAATRLDPANARLELSDGSCLDYRTCVVATGARARPSPWGAPEGVHLLRTLADSRRLRAALNPGARLVVVGGGFIGSEVAATAITLGCRVTMVDPLAVPLARVLGEQWGARLARLHAGRGVLTRLGTGVEGLRRGDGTVQVLLTDGDELSADTVVVGIGAVPNDGWLESSGLRVDNGLVCDEFCRAVDAPGVFAAGDVARWWHPGHREHTRVEHWTNAVEMAATVAHNIAHPDDLRTHAPVEYVWSDQYDWKVQVVGRPARGEAVQSFGSPDGSPAVQLFAGGDGLLTGAVAVNWPRALIECRRQLAAGSPADQAVARVAALPAPGRRS